MIDKEQAKYCYNEKHEFEILGRESHPMGANDTFIFKWCKHCGTVQTDIRSEDGRIFPGATKTPRFSNDLLRKYR